jgi:polyhydroxyalkanoate synthesis regulator phasin
VAAGKITQAEADQRLADMANHKGRKGVFDKNETAEQKSEREKKMTNDLAIVLGTTQADILAKLSAGSSPRDIIAASGKDAAAAEAQLDTLRQADMKAHLAADVASGKITQAEADRISTDMANHKGGPGAEGRGGRDNINKITHNKPVTK